MLASNMTGMNAISMVAQVTPEAVETREAAAGSDSLGTAGSAKKTAQRSMTVEEYVKSYFSDIPIMAEIAKCESRFRQYDKNGNVLRGEENSLDRGVMQINEYYHGENSEKLGYDILTLEGNTAYARHLFEKYGLSPWKSSAPCWGRTTTYSDFYKNLASRE